jgi:hypothetical protein
VGRKSLTIGDVEKGREERIDNINEDSRSSDSNNAEE